eukprot:TRINITY_DN1116_c0_g1_i7.p1 TRINITY_DN1116_c0_g1~~TRINITY_DN1116_c0_g1_i7.p1  ORF type:complete len:1483 (-),score=432.76 TRINITY_DN1116_c0_g1_i7:175-4623(-)
MLLCDIAGDDPHAAQQQQHHPAQAAPNTQQHQHHHQYEDDENYYHNQQQQQQQQQSYGGGGDDYYDQQHQQHAYDQPQQSNGYGQEYQSQDMPRSGSQFDLESTLRDLEDTFTATAGNTRGSFIGGGGGSGDRLSFGSGSRGASAVINQPVPYADKADEDRQRGHSPHNYPIANMANNNSNNKRYSVIPPNTIVGGLDLSDLEAVLNGITNEPFAAPPPKALYTPNQQQQQQTGAAANNIITISASRAAQFGDHVSPQQQQQTTSRDTTVMSNSPGMGRKEPGSPPITMDELSDDLLEQMIGAFGQPTNNNSPPNTSNTASFSSSPKQSPAFQQQQRPSSPTVPPASRPVSTFPAPASPNMAAASDGNSSPRVVKPTGGLRVLPASAGQIALHSVPSARGIDMKTPTSPASKEPLPDQPAGAAFGVKLRGKAPAATSSSSSPTNAAAAADGRISTAINLKPAAPKKEGASPSTSPGPAVAFPLRKTRPGTLSMTVPAPPPPATTNSTNANIDVNANANLNLSNLDMDAISSLMAEVDSSFSLPSPSPAPPPATSASPTLSSTSSQQPMKTASSLALRNEEKLPLRNRHLDGGVGSPDPRRASSKMDDFIDQMINDFVQQDEQLLNRLSTSYNIVAQHPSYLQAQQEEQQQQNEYQSAPSPSSYEQQNEYVQPPPSFSPLQQQQQQQNEYHAYVEPPSVRSSLAPARSSPRGSFIAQQQQQQQQQALQQKQQQQLLQQQLQQQQQQLLLQQQQEQQQRLKQQQQTKPPDADDAFMQQILGDADLDASLLDIMPTPAQTLPSYIIPMSEIQQGERVGVGNHGVTVHGGLFRGERKVTFKKWKGVTGVTPGLIQEIEKLMPIQGKHIVPFYGAVLEPQFGTVSPYIQGASLYGFTRNQGLEGEKNVDALIIRLAKDIASAMQYIHAQGVIHRSLSPKNVILDQNLDINIKDFGLCSLKDDILRSQYSLSSMPADDQYIAPELFRAGGGYDSKVDVFSFGVIVWEMYNRGSGLNTMRKEIVDGIPMYVRPAPPGCPFPVEKLLKVCLSSNPATRPSFDVIVKILSQPLEVLTKYAPRASSAMPADDWAGGRGSVMNNNNNTANRNTMSSTSVSALFDQVTSQASPSSPFSPPPTLQAPSGGGSSGSGDSGVILAKLRKISQVIEDLIRAGDQGSQLKASTALESLGSDANLPYLANVGLSPLVVALLGSSYDRVQEQTSRACATLLKDRSFMVSFTQDGGIRTLVRLISPAPNHPPTLILAALKAITACAHREECKQQITALNCASLFVVHLRGDNEFIKLQVAWALSYLLEDDNITRTFLIENGPPLILKMLIMSDNPGVELRAIAALTPIIHLPEVRKAALGPQVALLLMRKFASMLGSPLAPVRSRALDAVMHLSCEEPAREALTSSTLQSVVPTLIQLMRASPPTDEHTLTSSLRTLTNLLLESRGKELVRQNGGKELVLTLVKSPYPPEVQLCAKAMVNML